MAAMAVFAQQKQKFSVVSFEELPLDMTAREDGAKDDGTGSLYAIIKVTSTNPDDDLRAYNFDFDYLKHVVEPKDGELWVYVQRNAKRVNISREGFHPLRNYDLHTTIQAGKVYSMQLTSEVKKVHRQIVQFNVTPADAGAVVFCKSSASGAKEVMLGVVDSEGGVAASLELGTYTYRVTSTKYHDSEGRFTLKDRYNTHVENVKLYSNFSTITLNAGDGVEIYIDDERVGVGTWTGVLKAGTYGVECRKTGHKPVLENIKVEENLDQTIQLRHPTPVIGALAVITHPLGAEVYIDGTKRGTTPITVNGLLVGKHTVELKKANYNSEIREFEIMEDDVTDCNVQLTKGYNVKSTGTGSAKAPIVYNADGTRRLTRTRTVHGVVIDKKGYPVVGAKVMGTGVAESTEVAYDGTFSLQVPEWLKSITVEHEDFADKKMKIHDGEMLVKMRGTRWFLNPVYSFSILPEFDEVLCRIGVMFGTINNWGWYVKYIVGFADYGEPALTAGVTKRISKSTYLYAGLGYAAVRYEDYHYYYNSGGYYRDYYEYHNTGGFMFDFGAIIKLSNHFNINLGCPISYGNDEYEVEPTIGVGYVF